MSSGRPRLIVAAFTVLCACTGVGQSAPDEPDGVSCCVCLVPDIDECAVDSDCERTASAVLARPMGTLEVDDAHVPSAQVRVARCVLHECRYAFAIEDRCYAGTPKPAHEVDCGRSDAELLQTAEQLRAAGDYFETVPCLAQ